MALEIACGRKALEAMDESSKIRLVDWVWELFGSGSLLDAADGRLGRHFDAKQMECLMVVGLWCAYPDPSLRPSIKQVMKVLNFEAQLPDLPNQLPVPTYLVPPTTAFSAQSSSVSYSIISTGR